jgi:DNA-directed RNA polymerase subunit omega
VARINVEDCLKVEPNRFALVQLATARTKQIIAGAPVLISDTKSNKAVVISLREISQNLVRFLTPEEEAVIKEREAEKEREAQEAAMARAAQTAALNNPTPAPTLPIFAGSSVKGSLLEEALLEDDEEDNEKDVVSAPDDTDGVDTDAGDNDAGDSGDSDVDDDTGKETAE